MKRLGVLLAVAAVTVGSACSSVTDRAAATVGDTRITADELEREVEVILDNDTYREALEQSYGSAVRGSAKGSFQTAFVAQVLKFRVLYELLEQELDRRGVEITDDDLAQGKEETESQFSGLPDGEKVLKSFPSWYRRQLDRQSALFFAAQRAIEADLDDPEAYYEANREEFVQACVAHLLVSTQDRPEAEARARAEELLQRLRAGEDFAAVAREASDDSTKANGGDLGCAGRGQYVEEFEAAVFEDAEVGEVFGPVSTQFGEHLILVRSRELPAYDAIREEVEMALGRAGQEALDAFATDATCAGDVDIEIDPRYGTWDRSLCTQEGGFPEIALPAQPTTTVGPVPSGPIQFEE